MAKYSCVVCGKEVSGSECCYPGGNKKCLCFDCRDDLPKEVKQLNGTKETKDFLTKIKTFYEKDDISPDLKRFFQGLLNSVDASVWSKQIKADRIKEIEKYVLLKTWAIEKDESGYDFWTRIECDIYDEIKEGYKLHTFGVGSYVHGYSSGSTHTSGGLLSSTNVHGSSSGSTSTQLVYHAVFIKEKLDAKSKKE